MNGLFDREAMEARRGAFLLMRRLFEAPMDRDFAAAVSGSGAARVLGVHHSVRGSDGIIEALDAGFSDDELGRLADAYTKLFVGPAGPAAPFWESVYLDDRELLFLPSTSEVRDLYRKEGLAVACDFGREAEDSLPHELDFLAHMTQRLLDALAEGDIGEAARLAGVSAEFERRHMQDWLPAFAERVARSTEAGFYAQLAAFVAGFVAADAAYLEGK